jgi:hypothetical protein
MALLASALLLLPEVADAALKGAAGGGSGGGGFAVLTRYIDRIATYLIPVGAALGVLGFIGVGILYENGDERAGEWAKKIVIGVVLILGSKGLIA